MLREVEPAAGFAPDALVAIDRAEALLAVACAGRPRAGAALAEAAARARALATDGPVDRASLREHGGPLVEELVAEVLPELCLAAGGDSELIRLLERAAELTPQTPAEFRLRVARGALGSPRALALRPDVGVQAVLATSGSLAGLPEASLWKRDAGGRPVALAAVGDRPSPWAPRLAQQLFEAEGALAANGHAERPHDLAVLAVRGRGSGARAALVVGTEGAVAGWRVIAQMAAGALEALLDREALLEVSSERESRLSAACERRLTRLALDLHDGPLQNVSGIAGDLKLIRHRIEERAAHLPDASRLLGSLGDLEARLGAIDVELRELATSLEAQAITKRPLVDVLRAEAEAFRQRCDIDMQLDLSGDLKDLTASQRIALARVIQEALANVRDHSHAREVRVSVSGDRDAVAAEVVDDGCGFDVEATLLESARRGRLGLVGISERVRLLGGACDIRSRPGGPTELKLNLPRWRPSLADGRRPEPVARLAAT